MTGNKSFRKLSKNQRDLKKAAINRTEKERKIARKFDKEFLMVTENMDMEGIIIMKNFGHK